MNVAAAAWLDVLTAYQPHDATKCLFAVRVAEMDTGI